MAGLSKERLEEIKDAFIRKYPHLSGLRNNDRQFFHNAARVFAPEGVTALELYRIITDFDFRL